MKFIVKVDSRGRIFIPQALREALGLEPRSFVEIELDQISKKLIIKPITSSGEVLLNMEVFINKAEDIVKIVNVVLENGVEVKLLKCFPNPEKCSITVGVLDPNIIKQLTEALEREGIKIIETSVEFIHKNV